MARERSAPVDPDDLPQGYPSDLVETAFLDDGTELLFRPMLPSDDVRLYRLFDRLSPDTLYMRFFTPVPRPRRSIITRLVTLDYVDRLAICAVVDDEIVGVARYGRDPQKQDEAEIAVLVEDAWQGRGIATRLLWRLTAAGRVRGIRVFVAEVLGENRRMMGLLGAMSTDLTSHLADGSYHVRMTLEGMRPKS